MSNILHRIDSFIEEDYMNISKAFLEDLSSLIQDYFEIEPKTKDIDFLFDKQGNDKNIQRFIAHCFLRIISNNNYTHLEDSQKHLVFKFIHKAIPEVYHMIGINEKTETYEKEKCIKEFILSREKEFEENTYFDGSLSNINKFQQDFRRLTAPKKNAVIQDFTLELLSKKNLDPLFNKLNEYLVAGEDLKYDIYLSLKDLLDQYIDEASKLGTKYSTEYIAKPFSNIALALLKDIESSPYNIPTTLKILKTEKKYPLTSGIKNTFNVVVSNIGKGIAKNVEISIIDYDKKNISIPKTELNIGNIGFESVLVGFEYEVINTTFSLLLELQLTWSSAINDFAQHPEVLELQSQVINIEWDKVKSLEPYNLEPVESEPELIGRENILQKLRNFQTMPIGSAYLYGQRRVGKTSIVKTLLTSNADKDLLIYYIEAGDWNDAYNASNSMNNLGEKICKKIKRFNPKFSSISLPDFNGSFNKITDFLDEVQDIDPNFKLVIILDEFDRISRNLYERGDVGQSFVLTLRSISNRPQFGFILVGGEKLEYILSQWQEFNKFSPVRVDYFSKERDWDDFKKLIQKPVEDILEVADSAITYIYEETAGNPYFTKKICMELFALMVSDRDIHVTRNEAHRATIISRDSANIGATDFSHFWEDGIKGKVEKEEETSLKRRKILICITQAIRDNKELTKENISDLGVELGLSSNDTDKYLTEFEHRKILASRSNRYHLEVNFFKEWLVAGGMEKIIATFEEEERVQIYQQLEENTKVKTEEIVKLLPNFKVYKGQEFKIETIRHWLDQFNDVFDQRLIFKLLENFKLYTESEIRDKFVTLFSNIKRELNRREVVRTLDSSKKKRDDILVTYLDKSPAKSGTYFTRLFADENNIYSDNVCVPDSIEKNILNRKNLNAIVVIDDFLGSGRTLIENVKNYFDADLVKLIKERGLIVVVGVVSGFIEAKEILEKHLQTYNIDYKVFVIDLLDNSSKCFDFSANIFTNPNEMRKVKSICEQKGEQLVNKNPLGFSDSQCLIAFPTNCPNNTLPIFWKKSKDWTPLFERN